MPLNSSKAQQLKSSTAQQLQRSKAPTPESGFTLAGLIVILTIIAIVIAYTVPEQWSIIMKRERERQTIFLMKQYARGILEFRRKHNGTNPVSLEQLREARQPRFLRGDGEWICPLNGSTEGWILVPPGAILQPPGANQNNPAGTAVATPSMMSGPSQLNPAGSPKDYVGEFIGVRPNATGPAMIALNGADDYSRWVYTAQDLQNEINQRMQAMAAP